MRVKVSDGSGIDSNKTGELISWRAPEARALRHEYPFVGGRTPEGMRWSAVKLDSGLVIGMPNNRLTACR